MSNFIVWGLKIKLRICISMGWNASWVNFDFESEPQKRKMVLTVYYRRVHTEEIMTSLSGYLGSFQVIFYLSFSVPISVDILKADMPRPFWRSWTKVDDPDFETGRSWRISTFWNHFRTVHFRHNIYIYGCLLQTWPIFGLGLVWSRSILGVLCMSKFWPIILWRYSDVLCDFFLHLVCILVLPNTNLVPPQKCEIVKSSFVPQFQPSCGGQTFSNQVRNEQRMILDYLRSNGIEVTLISRISD